jgi:signal transduction histidine kinase
VRTASLARTSHGIEIERASRTEVSVKPPGRIWSVMGWWKRRPEIVRDAVGAVPFVLVFIVAQQIYGDGGPILRAIVIVLVMGLALTFRRRWPVVTFAAALLTVAVATTGLEFLALASYTVVAYEPRARPAVVAVVSAFAMTVGYLQYWPALVLEDVAGDLILIAAISVLPAVLGHSVREARCAKAELQSRNAELVALREREAAHAVEAERFRIARELHDVVAHHVSAMTVRARAGRHVASRDPQAAADALAYIADAGSQTLTAMGTFVGTLRGQAASDGEGVAPQPSLRDLPELLESFRRAGLVVHPEIDAASASVSTALGLNAYRIVEEALTNAMRHGGAERVWVRVSVSAETLDIQVDDNGRGLRSDGRPAGHGLIGVAERAALHDGASAIGPSHRGGCRLRATLSRGQGRSAELEADDTPAVAP